MSRHAIFMVDDEPNVLKAFQRALRKEPYTLFTAASGAEGLKLLEALEVSLIISDYNMPQMNGLEFLNVPIERKQLGRYFRGGHVELLNLMSNRLMLIEMNEKIKCPLPLTYCILRKNKPVT